MENTSSLAGNHKKVVADDQNFQYKEPLQLVVLQGKVLEI